MVFRRALAPMVPVVTAVPADPAPGEIVIQLHFATICGSDLHTYLGRRHEPTPSVLGHEGVGRIVALGGAL